VVEEREVREEWKKTAQPGSRFVFDSGPW